jgi:hypothetical protein
MSSSVSSSSTSKSDSKNDSYLSRPPMFNGYIKQFAWWKNKLYSFCITQDGDIWDVIKDDTTVDVDNYVKSVNRKGFTVDEKNNTKSVIKLETFW